MVYTSGEHIMRTENIIRRAQVYRFLAEAHLFPHENWTEDSDLVVDIVRSLGWKGITLEIPHLSLAELQSAYLLTFGATGSLCYETEYGLPHEYRQSQEMADIAGFYLAFGFKLNGRVRERSDHVAVELEFMHALALKEAYALETNLPELLDICVDAQRKFLQDHLGRWVGLFAESVAHNSPGSLYVGLAQFTAAFVQADAEKLGVKLDQLELADIQHTPFDPDFSCATCEVAGLGEQGFIRLSEMKP